MKNLIGFFLGVLAIGALYFGVRYLTNVPNRHLIGEEYFACEKKKLLTGGIYGKGPIFEYPEKGWCWRWDWDEVSRIGFKELGTKWYSVDWANESQWWRSP